VKLAQIVIFSRVKRATCGMLLFSSSQHYKNPRDHFANGGRKKKIPLWDSLIHILG
jgi:hypothetical protein